MKTLTLLVVQLLIGFALTAQVFPYHSPTGRENVSNLAIGPQGSLYVVLSYDENSERLITGENETFLANPQMAGVDHQAIIKQDANGSVAWTRVFSSSDYLYVYPFQIDASGRVHATVSSSGSLYLEGSLIATAIGNSFNRFNVLLDDQGNLLKMEPIETFSGGSTAFVRRDLIIDLTTRNLYDLYSFNADSIRVDGATYSVTDANTAVLVSEDAMGNILWEAKAPSAKSASIGGLMTLVGAHNDHLYAKVDSKGEKFYWNGNPITEIDAPNEQAILKIDAVTGAISDVITFTMDTGWVNQVLEDSQGNRYVSGTMRDEFCMNGKCTTPGDPMYGENFILKLNAQNEVEWKRQIGHPDPFIVQRVVDIALDEQENLVVVGMFSDTLRLSPFKSLTTTADMEVFVVTLSPWNHVLETAQTFSEPLVVFSDTWPNTAALDQEGNIWVGGYLNGKTDFGNGYEWSNTNRLDGFLWNATPALVTGLPEEGPGQESMHHQSHLPVFPNPACNVVSVQLPAATTAEIRLLNLQGQVLHRQQSSAASRTVSLPIGELAPGVYLLHVQDEQGHSWREKFIKQK